MMHRKFLAGLAGLLLLVGLQAQAQNQFEGVDIYVTGATSSLGSFTPGHSPSFQLRDDGTLGDATASDKIYSVDLTPPAQLGKPNWKVASIGWSPVSVPGGTDNSFCRLTGAGLKFVFDTNTKGDGYVPDPDGSSIKGFLYTIPSAIASSDTVRATGSFVSELGGADWNAADPAGLMHDDGINGDTTASDGIYTLAFTGIPIGSYEFKITFNADWGLQISSVGFANGGGNVSLPVLATTDNIKILANINTGRVKVENDNPLANPGPPFFATSSAWGTGLGSTTQLFDDGTNGDVTGSDGIYSRTFVASGASSYTVQVKQGLGPSYPGTGSYPFKTGAPGQAVLVQFDTNTVSDGYSPSTRYVWVDPAARRIIPYVQAVGDFMADLGGSGNWNNNDPNFELLDGGATGDAVAGDAIYAKSFTNPSGVTSRQFKGLGQQGSWDYQFGGAGDGATLSGNNPAITFSVTAGTDVTFQVDAVTGRIAVGTTLPTRPATIDAAAATTAATHWELYE
ncbi:MAG: choice-of-anchor X domain-containing protein [bacterium]